MKLALIFLVFLHTSHLHADEPEVVSQQQWTFQVQDDAPDKTSVTRSTGLVLPQNWRELRPKKLNAAASPSIPLPESFDWRKVVDGGLTPIRNQGNCGSCWAFATTASFADVMRIKETTNLDLSEQQLLSCNKQGYSCNGGFVAFDFLKSNGIAFEADFPYKGADLSCKSGVKQNDKVTNWDYVDTGSNIPKIEAIKEALILHGPLWVGVDATNSFINYKSGIYNANDGRNLNHAVNLVGWDDAGGYWIMRNSWGTSWGEKGYMRIKYGSNSIGYAAAYMDYDPKCPVLADIIHGETKTTKVGEAISIGPRPTLDTTYKWQIADGLSEPDVRNPNPVVNPSKSTVYVVYAQTRCGSAVGTYRVNVQ